MKEKSNFIKFGEAPENRFDNCLFGDDNTKNAKGYDRHDQMYWYCESYIDENVELRQAHIEWQ